jgi:signal transduction histidine kinase
MLQTVKSEILIMLASSSAFLRIEKNIGYKFLEELTHQNIKVKILFPSSKIEFQKQVDKFKLNYPRIEFRTLQSKFNSFIGLTIIDKQRVLITEVKDDTKIKYTDAIGTTIFIEGKYTAMSYESIFNNLWRQTELYSNLEKAFIRLQSHEKMQKEFIEIAAHEIRTPIQPILGFAEHLKNNITDKEQAAVFIDIIYRNSKKLKKLSEDILDISKIENNLLNLNKTHFKIKELIHNILINYKKEAQVKNVEFDLIDSDNDFVIYADKPRIYQVISNLISNSIKFTPKDKQGGGIVSILVQKMAKDKDNDLSNNSDNNIKNNSNNQVVIISIKDNGVGIDKDILPLIFKKFVSKSFQGTGLGLYICKSIVEDHGGKIWAKNNNEDEKGATFSFSVPLDN